MRRAEAEHLARLLEARVLPKAREEFVHAGMKRIALDDLLGPALESAGMRPAAPRSGMPARRPATHGTALGVTGTRSNRRLRRMP